MNLKSSLPVGILFPMEFEAKPIWKKLPGTSAPHAGLETKRGFWKGTAVITARIGMGRPGLDKQVGSWLSKNPVRALILAGLGGALDSAWEEGDMTVHHPEAWPDFLQYVKSRPSLRTAKWHTAKEIIATGPAKLDLGRKTGCGIVEMEWDYVAEACREHNIPLVGIRAVSDNSDRPLPAADLLLLGCDRETGKTTPGKMAAHLVFRPWRLKDLIPTALTCAHARNEMARELMGFLDQLS